MLISFFTIVRSYADKNILHFQFLFAIIPIQLMQGSYIGNTTASQAVKAGSIPVPCSTKKESFVYQTKDSFFELSVPYGTISTPSVREAMLRIVKCLRA